MIPNPLGIRLDASQPLRDQIRSAAQFGARGVLIDAVGDVSPDRLSETGRRELRHLLRSVELKLIGLSLPTRRPFDTLDQLDERLNRAERAFSLAFELGAPLVVARVGGLPPEGDAPARDAFLGALRELNRRAEHRGVKLGVETGPDRGETLRGVFESLGAHSLVASLDPGALLQHGHDPVAAAQELGEWVGHSYATEAPASSIIATLARRPSGVPGRLDWESYLGALEEVGYRGFLTVWPDTARDPRLQFQAVAERLKRF